MQIAARSYLTAGVAMVGATALIASPISPSAPQDIKVPAIYAAEVALTAGFDPITPYVNFFNDAAKNIGLIGQAWLAQPAPILSQIVANQRGYAEQAIAILQGSVDGFALWASTVPDTIQLALDELRAGNFGPAISQVASLPVSLAIYAGFPLLSLFDIPTAMAQNFANVITKLPIAIRILGFNAINIYGSFANIGYSVIDPLASAVKAGDIGRALSIVLTAPALIANEVINMGILKPGPFSPGLIYNLINFIPRLIATAITPPPPEPEFFNTVASLPSAGAQLVSLNTGSTPAETASGQTPDEEASGDTAGTAPGTETGTATEETPEPEAETPATDVVDETEGTDEPTGTDETEGTEESDETTGSEETDGSEESDDSDSPNGATDLSGGNKAEPGTTGAGTNTGSGTGTGTTDEPTTPTTGSTETNTGTGSSTTNSGNDAGSSNDGSDSGSDS